MKYLYNSPLLSSYGYATALLSSGPDGGLCDLALDNSPAIADGLEFAFSLVLKEDGSLATKAHPVQDINLNTVVEKGYICEADGMLYRYIHSQNIEQIEKIFTQNKK